MAFGRKSRPAVQDNRPVRIFISHSHQDAKLARQLVDTMKDSLWVPSGAIVCTSVDGYCLPRGRPLVEELRKALKSTKVFILLVTPHAQSSDWVHFELGAACGLYGHGSDTIQAYRVNDEVRPPEMLNGVTHGDLTKAKELEKLFEFIREKTRWKTRRARPEKLKALRDDICGHYANLAVGSTRPILHFAYVTEGDKRGYQLRNSGSAAAHKIRVFHGPNRGDRQPSEGLSIPDVLEPGMSVFLWEHDEARRIFISDGRQYEEEKLYYLRAQYSWPGAACGGEGPFVEALDHWNHVCYDDGKFKVDIRTA